MAQPSPEVEVVKGGILTSPAVNGSFVQNMYWFNNDWSVRKGFGQIAEFDSTLSRWTEDPSILTELEGLTKHLGSYLMETKFGHEQIISVFEILGWTSTLRSNASERLHMYSVQIYDVTTDEHWEEILSNTPVPTPAAMPWYKGNFEDSTPLVYSKTSRNPVTFVEKGDTLFFNSASLGTYYYKPSNFRGNRGKSLGGPQTPNVYSDNTLTKRVVPTGLRGQELAGIVYYEFFPEPINSITTLGDRMIYASDTNLYASDEAFPTNINVFNKIRIPTENPITALREINGNLIVFSEKETFIVQPPDTYELNSALVTKISTAVGCSNTNTITSKNNTIVWVDKNGVYENTGQLNITSLSRGINTFFNDYMPNPLSFYLRQSGTSVGFNQPDIQNYYDDAFASLHYYEHLRLLFLTIPSQRITLCQSENGEWSLWNYSSSAVHLIDGVGVDHPQVFVNEYMACEQLVSSKTELYAIGLDDTNSIRSDKASTWDRITSAYVTDINRNQPFRSYFITQYGRGGGVDRSTEFEDYRYGIGEWDMTRTTAVPTEGGVEAFNYDTRLIFDEPIILDKSSTAGFGGDDADVLIPIAMSQNTLTDLHARNMPLQLRIRFRFDSDHWDPITAGLLPAGEPICLIEPSQVSSFIAGTGFYNPNWAMVAGDYMTRLGSGVNRDQIQIDWSSQQWRSSIGILSGAHFFNQLSYADFLAGGATAGIPIGQPCLPLVLNEKVTLFYIPFKRLKKEESVSSMNIHEVESFEWYDTYDGYPVNTDSYGKLNNYIFNFSSLGFALGPAPAALNHDMNIKDVVAQGVDWCYSSEPIGLDDANRYKARGVYSQIKSQNVAITPISNGWGTSAPNTTPRVFNTVVAGGNRQWNSQVIDYGSVPPGIKQSEITAPSVTSSRSIITKIRDTAQVMRLKIFGNTDLLWGQQGTNNGNVLVDDQQFGTLADSNSTRGESINWMFFGYILDKAEGLVLRSAKAAIRKLGGRRRKGQ